MQNPKLIIAMVCLLTLSACNASKLEGTTADGKKITVLYYDGGSKLEDLLIISEINYFGKASLPEHDDPLGDVGFRFKSGERLRAECVSNHLNSLDKPECDTYEVFKSSFALIPEGTRFPRPKLF